MSKSFGASPALREVSIALLPAEVHVIAGENGAGKSTLIRILSGVHGNDAGELWLDGRLVRFENPAQARAAGIATIHQELSLVPCLSVTDNVLLGRPGRPWSLVSRAAARREATRLLAWSGLDLDPSTAVEALPFSARQMLEIARAMSEDARVLILDEATSALSEPEAERLFARIEQVARAGASVVYISHRMQEIYRLAQRISVLRDGALVLTRPVDALPESELLSAMVGRQLELASGGARLCAGPELTLSVRGLCAGQQPELAGLSFDLARGEILGLAGLRDSGAGVALRALAGSARLRAGSIDLGGSAYRPANPRAAFAAGVAFLPADRGESVFAELSLLWNATLSSLGGRTRWGFVERAPERQAVANGARQVRLKAHTLDAPARTLSGGNQQKLALLRCLMASPRLLLLEDPTRGVDVAAKDEIYALVRALAAQGVAVLLHGSELDQLSALCDQVLVLYRGHVVERLARGELSRERLLSAMMGKPS